jgi:hypothetical protein
MASRRAYFRSSLTPKACLWAFSSRLSSRLLPSPGARQSLCSKAAQALQGVGVLAVQDVGPVEAQGAVVGPLVAVQQQPFVQTGQDDVARRGLGAEHGVGQQVGPGLALHLAGHALGAVEQADELVVEQVFLLGAGLVSGNDHQARCLQVRAMKPQGHGHARHQLMRLGQLARCGVAQRLQQARLQLGEELPALGVTGAARHLASQAEPALGPGLQALVRCAPGLFARVLCFSGLPGLQARLDVALEDFGQVVVAVELVFVGDASEGVDGFEDGHGQAPALVTAAST